MFIIFLILGGAATGYALNRAAEGPFEDIPAAALGAAATAAAYAAVVWLLPLVVSLLGYVLIVLVILGLAAALYLFARKR